MKNEFIKLSLLACIWLSLASCNDPNFTQADLYKIGLNMGLGTNYSAWADFALGGRLGTCVLVKPPAKDTVADRNPYDDKCEYYLRTAATNSQGLKGYQGGVGCIPKSGSGMWGHTYLTKTQTTSPANIKNWVGAKIANLVLNVDTDDSRCQIGSFITNNSTRLALFDQIDFQTQAQLNHLVWTAPDVCGFRMPEMFPLWNDTTHTSTCYTPLVTGGSQPFCRVAYNRYINLNGGTPPTFISQAEMTAGTNYLSSGVLNNTDLISTLHSKFMGVEGVPELTDAVLKNSDGSEWNPPLVSPDDFDTYSKNLVWSVLYDNFVISPNTVKGINGSYLSNKLMQAVAQTMFHCAGKYNNVVYPECNFHGDGTTPPLNHADNAANPVQTSKVPPSITYNRSTLAAYNITTSPGIVGMPIDILNSLTVQYSYTQGYKLKSNDIFSWFYTPRTISSLMVSCPLPVSWAGINPNVIAMPNTTLGNTAVLNPPNWN